MRHHRTLQLLALGLLLLLAGCNAASNKVTWQTASEVETAGFNIYRGSTPDGPWTKINADLIPPSQDPVRGGNYEYRDTTAQAGQVYYYQLEEIELNGNINRFPSTRLETGTMLAQWWPAWVVAAAAAVGIGWWLGGRRKHGTA